MFITKDGVQHLQFRNYFCKTVKSKLTFTNCRCSACLYLHICLPLYSFITSESICQVRASGHHVPDCREDCRDEGSGRGGRSTGDVHCVCHCGSPDPWPLCLATALLPGDQEESLQLHWWPAAGTHYGSGNLIQVSLMLCPAQTLVFRTFACTVRCMIAEIHIIEKNEPI